MKYPTLDSVINDKELEPFGKFLIPSPMGFTKAARKLTLDQLSLVMPWHTDYHVEDSLDVIHELKERKAQGQPVFFDIYSEEEKRQNPRLKGTGLFYFSGKPGMPFAIICAGGGFVYVASLHESLPAALYLSRLGIHAFAIQYRTSSAREACEDLARAIGFIFRHADELGLDTGGYSLWGGSAGARMAAYLGGLSGRPGNGSVRGKEISPPGSRNYAVHRSYGMHPGGSAHLCLCGRQGFNRFTRHYEMADSAAGVSSYTGRIPSVPRRRAWIWAGERNPGQQMD
jgi:hypothetical protein